MNLSDRQIDFIIENQRVDEKCGGYHKEPIKEWCPKCKQKEIISNPCKEQFECCNCDYTLHYEAEYFTPEKVEEYESFQKEIKEIKNG